MKGVTILILTIIVLLSIPLIAMQFTDEVVWTLGDFIVAGGLLFLLGFIILFLKSLSITRRQKTLMIVLALVGFLYIWAELAVGLFF